MEVFVVPLHTCFSTAGEDLPWTGSFTAATTVILALTQQLSSGENPLNLQNYASCFRSKNTLKRSHKHQLLYARERDDDAWPKCHEEERRYCSASCCTVPSPATSRSQSLALRPVAKRQSSQNIPIYWGQRHPGSLLSHFMFLNNSNADTHHLKCILATRSDKVRTKNKEKKKSLVFAPNRFKDSPVRHYSSPLNDLHDLIFQRLTHFLVQSQNIIFYLLWERKETAKSEVYMLKKPTQQHSSPLSYITYTYSSQQCCRASN